MTPYVTFGLSFLMLSFLMALAGLVVGYHAGHLDGVTGRRPRI